MGILADLMGESLMGQPAPRSQADAANYLADRLGSGRAAARALGVAESTFRGWRSGVTSKRGIGTRLTVLARQMAPGLPRARTTGSLAIHAEVTMSSDTRERTLHVGRKIPQPLIRRALTAWAMGNDRAVETLLTNAILKYYFEDTETIMYMQPKRVWFE